LTENVGCEFAEQQKTLISGRMCRLDRLYCPLWKDVEAAAVCPTLAKFKSGRLFPVEAVRVPVVTDILVTPEQA